MTSSSVYLGKGYTEVESVINKLRAYYASHDDLFKRSGKYVNGVYVADTSGTDYADEWHRRVKPLRNVVGRAVDFFALKMLPGELSVVTDKDPLKEAVEQVLTWSNFAEKKKLYLTDLSLTGDIFFKVNVTPDKVYFQYIPPEDVTAINEDWRGYLTDIRIEYMVEDKNGLLVTNTEFWNKEYFAIWEHNLGKNMPLEELGMLPDTLDQVVVLMGADEQRGCERVK